jgi:hypothetical protein
MFRLSQVVGDHGCRLAALCESPARSVLFVVDQGCGLPVSRELVGGTFEVGFEMNEAHAFTATGAVAGCAGTTFDS